MCLFISLAHILLREILISKYFITFYNRYIAQSILSIGDTSHLTDELVAAQLNYSLDYKTFRQLWQCLRCIEFAKWVKCTGDPFHSPDIKTIKSPPSFVFAAYFERKIDIPKHTHTHNTSTHFALRYRSSTADETRDFSVQSNCKCTQNFVKPRHVSSAAYRCYTQRGLKIFIYPDTLTNRFARFTRSGTWRFLLSWNLEIVSRLHSLHVVPIRTRITYKRMQTYSYFRTWVVQYSLTRFQNHKI